MGKKLETITLDFTGVTTHQLIEEGEYLTKVLKVEVKESPNRPEPYLSWEFEIVDGHSFVGSHLFDNTSTSSKALWRLRKRLECLGFEIPEGPMELDPLSFVDEQLVIKVGHEDYQDKKFARVVDEFEASHWSTDKDDNDDDDSDEDDDSDTEDEEDIEEEDSEEDEDSESEEFDYSEADIMKMSKTELDEVIDEYELDDSLRKTRALGVKRKKVYNSLKEQGYAS